MRINESSPVSRRQSGLRFAARATLSIGSLSALIWLIGLELDGEAYTLVSIPRYAVAALLSIAGTVIIPAMLTHAALRQDRISLTLRELIEINLAMRFYVIVLPRAVSVAIRWYRYGITTRASDSLALMLFERIIQLLVFFSAAFALLSYEELAGHVEAPVLLSALGAFAVGLLALTLSFWSERGLAAWRALVQVFDRIPGARFRRALDKLHDAVQAYQHLSTLERARILALALASYAFFVFSAWIVADGMGLAIDIVSLGWIRPVVFLVTLIPIAVGGIGVREGAFVALLSLYGVPASTALAFSLVLFSIQLLIAGVGAAVEVVRFAGRRRPSQGRPGA